MFATSSLTIERLFILLLTMLLAGWSLNGVAAITTNTSAGDWTAVTWNPSIPTDGDTVVINSNVTLTTATPALADLTINSGKTISIASTNGLIRAANVTVSGNITHNAQSATTTNAAGGWDIDSWVSISCSNLVVAGTINCDAKGFTGAPRVAASRGRGPGGGPGSANGFNGGGGYGGNGGSSDDTTGGGTYGTANDVTQPGSGAGGSSSGASQANGGGLVKITAMGPVTVNGSISANGANGGGPGSTYGAGGSGGGIRIQCTTLAGSGLISANGGAYSTDLNGYRNGSGGGGRIAVTIADPAAQAALGDATIRFSASYGNNAKGAGLGSIYLPETRLLKTTFTNDGGAYSGFSTWAPSSLFISNANVAFDMPGVSITVSNDISVMSGTLIVGAAAQTITNPVLLSCGGNLLVTNTSVLRVYASGLTNASAVTNYLAPAYGGQVTVGGALLVRSGCTVYPYSHPTNGGSVIFNVGSATIAGIINADTNGFRGGTTAASDRNGYGPGQGKATADWQWAGGGYGGKGSLSGGGTGGATNGISNAPVAPGSGGCANSAVASGLAGGGLVRINTTGTLTLTGTLTANGGNAGATRTSAGSGGAIFLTCKRFDGPGTMTANGGVGQATDKADGGGGRIAIEGYTVNTNGCTFSVIKGTAGGNAADGTLSVITLPAKGTVIMLN